MVVAVFRAVLRAAIVMSWEAAHRLRRPFRRGTACCGAVGGMATGGSGLVGSGGLFSFRPTAAVAGTMFVRKG